MDLSSTSRPGASPRRPSGCDGRLLCLAPQRVSSRRPDSSTALTHSHDLAGKTVILTLGRSSFTVRTRPCWSTMQGAAAPIAWLRAGDRPRPDHRTADSTRHAQGTPPTFTTALVHIRTPATPEPCDALNLGRELFALPSSEVAPLGHQLRTGWMPVTDLISPEQPRCSPASTTPSTRSVRSSTLRPVCSRPVRKGQGHIFSPALYSTTSRPTG